MSTAGPAPAGSRWTTWPRRTSSGRRAVGLYTNTGEGLHRFVDPVDGAVYLYSQFETADAKRLYACFDQPDLKARFTFTVTAPADWQVIVQRRDRPTGPARPAPRCTPSPPPSR